MWAVQYTEYGEPEVLQVGEAEEPHAGRGQVRIRVHAAGLNPYDVKVLRGQMAQGRPLEGIGRLGIDASGVVDEVGEGVSGVQVGDDVFGRGQDTLAEYAVLADWAAKPASVDWAAAGAVGVAAETSERALRLLGVQPGQTLFIDGAAGGVGAVASQIAVARGITVIGSASQDNHDYLREIGVSPVLYGSGVVNRVRASAGTVDAVFDVAGKTPIEDLISLVAEPAQVLTIANFGAAGSGVKVTGGSADSRPVPALTEAAQLLEQGKLVVKFQTFPFDRAVEAYRILAEGHARGKLVLVP